MVEKNRIERALNGLHKFEVTLLAAILIAMVLVATAQILLRNFFATGLIWSDPLLRAMLLWLGLLGAVVASHDNKHISIDVLSRFVPAGWRRWLQMTTSFFTALVCLIVAFQIFRHGLWN
jgi:TRAP-type C4-dicarboxylate transport system permease small subunit